MQVIKTLNTKDTILKGLKQTFFVQNTYRFLSFRYWDWFWQIPHRIPLRHTLLKLADSWLFLSDVHPRKYSTAVHCFKKPCYKPVNRGGCLTFKYRIILPLCSPLITDTICRRMAHLKFMIFPFSSYQITGILTFQRISANSGFVFNSLPVNSVNTLPLLALITKGIYFLTNY